MHSPTRTSPAGGAPAERHERFTISARRYRTVVAVALGLLSAIVVTGAAVRLTGSGLGCETWPNCSEGQFLEFSSPNQSIEQVNRMITGLVSISVIAAVLGSLRRRPYRRDLVWWSLSLVAGVLAQIVLGGITVLVDLHPLAVAGHFVLSMVLVACATVLLWRSGQPEGTRRVRVASSELWLSRAAFLAACALMLTGPVVTGSGPHAGDERAERFGFFIPDVVRVHSINMWIFLAITVVLLARLARGRAPADVMVRGRALLIVIAAQGVIGFTQYGLGVPEWLVLAHIAGATAIMCAVVWFHLGLSGPPRPGWSQRRVARGAGVDDPSVAAPAADPPVGAAT